MSRYVVTSGDRPLGSGTAHGGEVLASVHLQAATASLALEVLSVPAGGVARETTAAEVLFVAHGSGTLSSGQGRWVLTPHCGVQVPAGAGYRVEPDPDGGSILVVRVGIGGSDGDPAGSDPALRAIAVRRLEDCRAGEATGGRGFRVLCDAASGFAGGTLFVGTVPPGPAAPVHYHTYDEVLFLLEGSGVLHIDGEHTPIGPGSCYRLPARTLHQIENTGATAMQEVGVFVPSGSPDAAYLPDGRAALAGLPDDPAGVAAGGSRPSGLAQ